MSIIRSAADLVWPADNPWETHRSDSKYDNRWINVTEHQVTTPGGKPGIYGQVSFKNIAVGVVALTDDQRVWLVGQYRYTLQAYSWEIVEGGSPIGEESPEATAHRELLEETGLRATHLEPLLTLHLSNSVSDELALIYLATDLTLGQAEPEDTEDLRLACLPLPEVLALIRQGRITDAITVAGVLEVALRLGIR